MMHVLELGSSQNYRFQGTELVILEPLPYDCQ